MLSRSRNTTAITWLLVVLLLSICWPTTAENVITLPSGLLTIEEEAFEGDTALDRVVIPQGTVTIDQNAFRNANLSEILIPGSVRFIHDNAFSGNPGLTIKCETGSFAEEYAERNSIDYYAFTPWSEFSMDGGRLMKYNGTAENVVIPDQDQKGRKIIRIDEYAFFGNTAVKTVFIPDSVTSIGDWAFKGCSRLKQVRISANWVGGVYNDLNYKGGPFEDTPQLSEIIIPDGCTMIPRCAFMSSGISKIVLPDSVITIENSAFGGCTNLSEVELSGNLQSIRMYAFAGCENLERISIPDSVVNISSHAFRDCLALQYVKLPSGWEQILQGYGAPFLNTPAFKQIDIPEGMTRIPYGAFTGTGAETVTIPESVTVIEDDVFKDCLGLTTITVPSSVKQIGAAFNGCTNLQTVILSKGLETIGGYAFHDCVSLQSIVIPDTVHTIYAGAFEGCTGLTNVRLSKNWTKCVENSIYWTKYYSPFTLCNSLQSIIVPEGATEIPSYAFRNAPIKHIFIPSSVQTIGNNAFSDDQHLYCEKSTAAWNELMNDNRRAEWDGINPLMLPYTVSGLVRTAPGKGIEGVYVYLGSQSQGDEYYFTTTNRDGFWTVNVASAEDNYAVEYYSKDYDISSDTLCVNSSDGAIDATAVLKGAVDEAVTFTIIQDNHPVNSVIVGTRVLFEVNVPADATYVRLIVDGKNYEEYKTNAGCVSFDRIFSQAGERSVQIQCYQNYEWAAVSQPSILHVTVTDNQQLGEPALSIPDTVFAGQEDPVTLILDAVPHANRYVAYVYYADVCTWSSDDGFNYTTPEAVSKEIPSYLFANPGEYSIQVVCSGVDYNSSTGVLNINIDYPAKTEEPPALISFSQGTYQQYAYYYQDSRILFSAEYNMKPDLVAAYCDGVKIGNATEDGKNRYRFSALLTEPGKHLFTFKASFEETVVEPDQPFPVYVLDTQALQCGSVRYMADDVLLERYPGSNDGTSISEGTPVEILAFYPEQEGYYYVKIQDQAFTGFVKAEDTASQYEDAIYSTGFVSVELDSDSTYRFTGDTISADFTVEDSVATVYAIIQYRTCFSQNTEETVIPYEIENGTGHFDTAIRKEGIYTIKLLPYNVTEKFKPYIFNIYGLKRKMLPNQYLAWNKEKNVFDDPVVACDAGSMSEEELSITPKYLLSYEDPFTCIGMMEDVAFIEYTDRTTKQIEDGFISCNEQGLERGFTDHINQPTKHGFVYVSSDLESNTKKAGEISKTKMENLFTSIGCDMITPNQPGYGSMISELQKASDFNDTCYIYILAHGKQAIENEKPVLDDNGDPILLQSFKFDGREYPYMGFLSDMMKITAQQKYVIIDSCFSGDIIRALDENRYSGIHLENSAIITSAAYNEEAPSYLNEDSPTPFVDDFTGLMSKDDRFSFNQYSDHYPEYTSPSGTYVSHCQTWGNSYMSFVESP